jgi:predicted kinase
MAVFTMICGLPGAGKTTLAKKLEKERGSLRLCADEWIVALYGDDIARDRDKLYAVRDAVEALQFDLTEKMLARDLDIILENGFWSRKERLMLRDKMAGLGAKTELIFLDVPRDILWGRLASRNRNLPPATFHVTAHELDEWMGMFEPPGPDENAERIVG